MSVLPGWRLTRILKSRLIRSSTSRSHWLSPVFAWHGRNYGVITPAGS